ncbi:hypothetical protein BDN72DRAFT_55269 [Pluteus cervinus]|uniref:Uncharacterized protein n=1 Tax=Pluteus cervinus TaxID=181527 RepID=A0ACD3B8T3_9AGAR|nr:hypothetical protein BDN72DRAFT_55269 [Pluteus cervinus]
MEPSKAIREGFPVVARKKVPYDEEDFYTCQSEIRVTADQGLILRFVLGKTWEDSTLHFNREYATHFNPMIAKCLSRLALEIARYIMAVLWREV